MPSNLDDIYWAGSLLPEILMILFTRSTAVLHKYLNDELKILRLLQFLPEVTQNSRRIPWVFHVLWNPWVFRVFQVCGHPDNASSTASQWWRHNKKTSSVQSVSQSHTLGLFWQESSSLYVSLVVKLSDADMRSSDVADAWPWFLRPTQNHTLFFSNQSSNEHYFTTGTLWTTTKKA